MKTATKNIISVLRNGWLSDTQSNLFELKKIRNYNEDAYKSFIMDLSAYLGIVWYQLLHNPKYLVSVLEKAFESGKI